MASSLEDAFAAASKDLGLAPESLEVDETGELHAEEAQPEEGQDPEAESEDDVVDEGETPEEAEDDTVEDDDTTEDVPATADIPDEYFGVALAGLPDEVKREVYDSLRNKDRYTNRLSQEKSGLEKEVAELREFIQQHLAPEVEEVDPEATFEMPSDDDITEYITKEYGLDKDDPFYEIQVKSALPGVKAALEANVRAQQLEYSLQLQEYERYYNGTLDKLERSQGELPVPREDFLAWAAENNLGDPQEAYTEFRRAAQSIATEDTGKHSAAAEAAAKAKADAKRALKKKASSTSSKSAAKTQAAKNTRPSLEEALQMAVKETGVELD